MAFEYFSKNGELLPANEAVIPLNNIEYAYGFGIYETIRVVHGKPLFVADHLARLMESAKLLELEHDFAAEDIERDITTLIDKNAVDACNLKLLLIGAPAKADATLTIQCLNPLFVDKKLYRDGAAFITYEYERLIPHAKSLNMLGSYRAYRKAKAAGAYDALLVDRRGNITEGTRTNFFALKGNAIFTPPDEEILLGVTRDHVLQVAKESGFTVEVAHIRPLAVSGFDAAFVTSTSTKILPLASLDGMKLPAIPERLRDLMKAFDAFLDSTER